MPIIRIRGEDGKFHPVPSTVGPPGKDGSPGKDGAPGADGGYYKPSVSESGDLTWTASKEGMPAVSGANIKGPQGNAGADGADGKTAYQSAQDGGYIGDEAEFNAALVSLQDAPFLPLKGGTLDADAVFTIPRYGVFQLGGSKQNPGIAMWSESPGRLFVSDAVINGVADPESANDAANKRYVDGKAGYTKVETWKSATAALFGLGADSVPDEAFAYVGKYNQHWWRRRLLNVGTEYITPVVAGNSSFSDDPVTYILCTYRSYDPDYVYYNLEYSDGITYGTDGKPTGLAAPIKTVRLSNSNHATAAQVLKGKFIIQRFEDRDHPSLTEDKGIAFIPENATFDSVVNYKTTSYVYSDYISIDITAMPKKGEWEYLQSNDDDAYPHSGESGGYEYEYLGIPFDNLVTAPKIATGSYVGTGTYGADNPNSLTFEFEPKLVVVRGSNSSSALMVAVKNNRSTSTKTNTTANFSAAVDWFSNSVSWFSYSTSESQLNIEGENYYYVAIG